MNDMQVIPSVSAPASFLAEAQEIRDNDDESLYPRMEEIEEDLSSLQFGNDVKVLLIGSPEYRLICHFLGMNVVRDVVTATYTNIMMVSAMMAECLDRFMDSRGYRFVGEIAFDGNGNVTPVTKKTWTLGNQEIMFTVGGLRFYESGSGVKGDNYIFQVWEHLPSGQGGFSLHASDLGKAKSILSDLEKYTKENNCVKGGRLRDVSMGSATFVEVVTDSRYDWKNYYYSEEIKEVFNLEVFGFVKNTKRYNAMGIKKRGVLLHGTAGTGKTTLGHIICNQAGGATVIWITPDLIAENNNGKTSIKLLYMLTEFVSPSVIILEDLDLFSEDREGSSDSLRLGALMNILDGVNSITNAVTVATTNRLNLVEKALSNRPGRFDRVVEIPPLDRKLRERMFLDRLKDCKIESGVIAHVVKSTDCWTGAEIQEFINSMNLYFINRDEDGNRVVTIRVIDIVLRTVENLCLQARSRRKVGFSSEKERD